MAPLWGPADDGKRFYSDGRCLANCSSLKRRGFGGGGAGDGKRFYSDGRCMANCSFKIGGGLGEDGARLDRAQRLADLYFSVFFVFFSASFLRSLFSGFSVFRSLWGSQRGSFLEHFCKKKCFLAKKGDLCFCTPLQRFGLILRV